jgi:hypothetical protein
MSVTSGVRHLLRRLNKWRLRTWYSKGCWQDSTADDTSARQGWVYGEGSCPRRPVVDKLKCPVFLTNEMSGFVFCSPWFSRAILAPKR